MNEIGIKQRDITDCGAACLASVAAYYHLLLPVSRIRQFAGTDKRGTSVLGLTEAAKKLGFDAKGARGLADSLPEIPLPAIAHVVVKNGLHHYVVIYKVKGETITIMDPADGKLIEKEMSVFAKEWTGILVLMLPGEKFVTGSHKRSNAARFWGLISPQRNIMLLALGGALIYTILGLSASIYIQKLIDFVLPNGNFRLLATLSVTMIILLILQTFIGVFRAVLSLQTGQRIDSQLILSYYKHLLKLPQRFFDTMRTGEIISRVNDAVKIRVFINDVAMNMIVNLMIVSCSLGLMFFYYWKLGLIMIAIVPVYLVIWQGSNRVNKKWQRVIMESNAELESQLVESINAIGTIKHFGIEQYANTKTDTRFVVLLRSIYKSSVKGVFFTNASDFITRLFTIIVLWAGGYFIISRQLSLGELLSFYALIGYFTGPASSLIGANKNIQDALIASDRLFEIIDLETEQEDEGKTLLTPEMIGDIEFNGISFRYGTREVVFDGLNLLIKKGSSTAIVGESGSGKSTVLSLLQNLYPLKGGCITIGGLDIKKISNYSLRKMIAVVPQQIDLFTGTIRENIAVGEPEPDMGRVIQLCDLLGIKDFIEQLPDTYNAILHEQGVNLSGGQRQRLAIARALYRNAEILVLDEATSSLDSESERKVQEVLQWYRQQGKTTIIIAHRLSTIRNCDTINVLKGGKLAEQGTHSALLQLNGIYAGMCQHNS